MEYEVRGIRTSLPFFHWILRQPAFESAEFHTEFLDELLQRRSGEGFSDIDPSLEEVAAIAACIADVESGRSDRTGPPESVTSTVGPVLPDGPAAARTWKGRARVEGLR